MKRRYAVIGTGHRSQMYLDAIADPHAEVAELVAMVDVNPGRMQWHRERHDAFADVRLAGPEEIEDVIRTEGVDRVVVTSVDRFHADHVVRALEAGADVIVEKPLTIDAPSARRIREAAERTGREVLVTFNYRYSPRNSALKEVVASGRIGRPLTMVFEWVLDTQHGADYFRRWHRDKENSGGLFVHKASHHFDLASWWLDTDPTRIYARGGLKFYGAEAARERGVGQRPERGTHDGSAADPFSLDLREDERLKELYLDQERYDGYRRDQDVFDAGITAEDNLTAIVDYASGAHLTYALNAHCPWEGYRVAINGTEGRAELEVVERAAVIREGGVVDPSAKDAGGEGESAVRREGERLVLQRHFERAEEVPILNGEGAHGGGDERMLAEVFRGRATGADADPLGRAADYRDGLRAISIGISGNESLRTGMPVPIPEFMAEGGK